MVYIFFTTLILTFRGFYNIIIIFRLLPPRFHVSFNTKMYPTVPNDIILNLPEVQSSSADDVRVGDSLRVPTAHVTAQHKEYTTSYATICCKFARLRTKELQLIDP